MFSIKKAQDPSLLFPGACIRGIESSPRRGTYREQPEIPEYRSQPVPPETFTRLAGVMVEGVCHPLRF